MQEGEGDHNNRFAHLCESDREFVEEVERVIINRAENEYQELVNSNHNAPSSWYCLSIFVYIIHIGAIAGFSYLLSTLIPIILDDDCNAWNCEGDKAQADSAFRIGVLTSMCIFLSCGILLAFIYLLAFSCCSRLWYIHMYMSSYYAYKKSWSFSFRAFLRCMYMFSLSFFVVESMNFGVQLSKDRSNAEKIGMVLFILQSSIALFIFFFYLNFKLFIYEPFDCFRTVRKAKKMIKLAEHELYNNMENGAHHNAPMAAGQHPEHGALGANGTLRDPAQRVMDPTPYIFQNTDKGKKRVICDPKHKKQSECSSSSSSSYDSSDSSSEHYLGSSSYDSPTGIINDDIDDNNIDECTICNKKKCDAVVLPCRHASFCYECVQEWRKKQNTCPACRRMIKDTLQVFK